MPLPMSGPRPQAPILLFDGVCNLCNGWVKFIIERENAQTLRFASLQSEVGHQLRAAHGIDLSTLDTLVLIEGGRGFTRSTAALKVTRHLRVPWSWRRVAMIGPRPIRDLLYRSMAKRRYRWFGRSETCRLPSPELAHRFIEA